MSYINQINLKMVDDTIHIIDNRQPFHLVENIPYGYIKQITIGENIRLYGLVQQNIEGRLVTKYLHLGTGNHNLEPPALFKSIHINNIDNI
jgi:hypothetical protein